VPAYIQQASFWYNLLTMRDTNEKIKIVEAITQEHIDYTRELFLEYARSLDFSLCFQDFDRELEMLPGSYARPDGCILLAFNDNIVAGCVAVRRFNENTCEMKRLYVKPGLRNSGTGRKLSQYIINESCKIGYERIVLDTLSTMKGAMALYKSLGFQIIEPYYYNPLENVCYYEKYLLQPI